MESISKEKAEELFNEYADFIFKTAYILTHSQFLADDILQESFIRIFKEVLGIILLCRFQFNMLDSKKIKLFI